MIIGLLREQPFAFVAGKLKFAASSQNNMNPDAVAVQENKYATIELFKTPVAVVVVTAKAHYIPIEPFKEVFNNVGALVEAHGVRKLIFDKRNLTVFHQPSMEWYFVDWKERMFAFGLTEHVKLLPDDEAFRQSVAIGRKKINREHPAGKFHEMRIVYAKTLAEAFEL